MVKFLYDSSYIKLCKAVDTFCEDKDIKEIDIVPKQSGIFGFIIHY